MRTDFNTKISASSRDLSAKERVMIKNIADAIQLDSLVKDETSEPAVIYPDYWVELEIHNEHANGASDYTKFVIVDKRDGAKYVTGSSSFINAFNDIADEIADEPDMDEWGIKVFRRPSKNYSGSFITCAIC